MNLAQTQARLYRAITEGKGEDVALVVEAGRRLSPERRVEIYAHMYLGRQVDALKEDFPKLAALLGDDGFAELVSAYVQVFPSEHPSLGRLGRKVAHFLAQADRAGFRPDLADLAALEWARAEVFVERDSPSAAADAFARVPAERFAEARCRLGAAWRLLSLRHDPLALWRAVENGEPVPGPIAAASHILVWRKGWAVYHAAVDGHEARALERAARGATLGEICEAFSARGEEAATAAFAALQSWVAEGLVAAVEPA